MSRIHTSIVPASWLYFESELLPVRETFVLCSPSTAVSFTAVRVTVCGVSQFAVVKVKLVAEAVTWLPGASVTVTVPDGLLVNWMS